VPAPCEASAQVTPAAVLAPEGPNAVKQRHMLVVTRIDPQSAWAVCTACRGSIVRFGNDGSEGTCENCSAIWRSEGRHATRVGFLVPDMTQPGNPGRPVYFDGGEPAP
jgi:hypothetical protein